MDWWCNKCQKSHGDPPQSNRVQNNTQGNPIVKNSLRIFQWNADGLSATKLQELSKRLPLNDIDICAIQETKWKPSRTTPVIKDYTAVRADRENQNGGGGLVFYLKSSLIFEHLDTTSENGTEVISIRVKIGRRRWTTIHNLYCPPKRSHSSSKTILTLDNVTISPETLLLGDFNAHTRLWDEYQPSDDRGDRLLDWCLTNNLHIMNDGTHTRVNTHSAKNKPSPASEGKSAPDVSICGTFWSSKYTWKKSEAIGSSDHEPIEITLNEKVSLQPIFKGIPRWKSKGVDWATFATEVDDDVEKIPGYTNVHRLAKSFEDTIIKAALKIVGTTTPGKGRKPWITPKVKEAIRHRNKLRKNISKNREEWLTACKAAREAILEAQENEWKKVLEDASESHDDTKLWKTIKTLNGTPDQSSPKFSKRSYDASGSNHHLKQAKG